MRDPVQRAAANIGNSRFRAGPEVCGCGAAGGDGGVAAGPRDRRPDAIFSHGGARRQGESARLCDLHPPRRSDVRAGQQRRGAGGESQYAFAAPGRHGGGTGFCERRRLQPGTARRAGAGDRAWASAGAVTGDGGRRVGRRVRFAAGAGTRGAAGPGDYSVGRDVDVTAGTDAVHGHARRGGTGLDGGRPIKADGDRGYPDRAFADGGDSESAASAAAVAGRRGVSEGGAVVERRTYAGVSRECWRAWRCSRSCGGWRCGAG